MRLIYPIFALVLGLLIWQGIVLTTGAPHFILPSPLRVAQAGIANRGLIFEHGVVTAVEVCLGLGIGAVLGAITAILMTASKAFE
ncbi:MAG: ABC transporter permease, partial [Halocynthiibacter sp.]